jgi:hypothetical protein
MTIHDMHIGLDLILQRINSNVFNKILPEEKDWYINVTTQELIRAVLLDEKNTVFNIITYADIRKYYEALQYYIRSVELSVNSNPGYNYVYGDFPVNIPMGKVTSGVLYKDIPYKVLVGGETDLTVAAGSQPTGSGSVFTCNPANLTGGGTLVVGETYRIINAAGTSLSAYGAPSDAPGTVFVCTAAAAPLAAVTSIIIERLTVKPTWAGATELTPISNFGYFNYLSSRSSVRYGQSIAAGNLKPGKKYYVYVPGDTDLSTVGGKEINDVGFIFTCTSAADITWEGGTVLYEVIDTNNRIVKAQDVYNFLAHSFGTTVSSPVAIIADNKIKVFHDYKFDVNRVYLDYIKEPVSVSKENNINSDLPVSLHAYIVDLTAKYILQTMANGVAGYQNTGENRQ